MSFILHGLIALLHLATIVAGNSAMVNSCLGRQTLATPIHNVQGRVERTPEPLGEWRPQEGLGLLAGVRERFGVHLELPLSSGDPSAVSRACQVHPFCFFENAAYVARTSNLFYDDTCETDSWQRQVYAYARAVADRTVRLTLRPATRFSFSLFSFSSFSFASHELNSNTSHNRA